MLFEIKYKHSMMSDDHVGKCVKHAHTKEQAIKYFSKKKPDKNGWTRTKHGVWVQIISVDEIPGSE
tara:strand:+ start:505 stop:702 length:198 start_codon:yes stop_codon:yes gene_type:complete